MKVRKPETSDVSAYGVIVLPENGVVRFDNRVWIADDELVVVISKNHWCAKPQQGSEFWHIFTRKGTFFIRPHFLVRP